MSHTSPEMSSQSEEIVINIPEINYENVNIANPTTASLLILKDYLKFSAKQKKIDAYQISEYWNLSKLIDAELNKREGEKINNDTSAQTKKQFQAIRNALQKPLFGNSKNLPVRN
jgi:glutaredoxin-related protein